MKLTFEQACANRSRETPTDLKLNPESIDSLEIFRAMARARLLTLDSQEGHTYKIKGSPIDDDLFQEVVQHFSPPEMGTISKDTWAKIDAEYRRRGGAIGDGMRYEKAYVWGFMLKEDAGRIAHAFNMLSDKIAMVVTAVEGDPPVYSIPVTFNRFTVSSSSNHRSTNTKHQTDQHLIRLTRITSIIGEGDVRQNLEELGIKKREMSRVTVVVFMDPKPGRRAKGHNGLYADIFAALGHKGMVRT